MQTDNVIEKPSKELVNGTHFNLYQDKISLNEDLLIYITSWGKLFGINMEYQSGYSFNYPEDKLNFQSSIGVIHNDKVIIIYDGKGAFLQAELPQHIHQIPSAPIQNITLKWEEIDTPFPKDSCIYISNYLSDIFMVFKYNNLYFYNSTRKNWSITTKLEPNTPCGDYLYHGKSLIASFSNTTENDIADIPANKTITYFLVVNPTANSDDLQFVPITNPNNRLEKFAPYTPLNILVDLQNPTAPTASLRYIPLDKFRATCYNNDNEWLQLPLPQSQHDNTSTVQESTAQEPLDQPYHPIYSHLMIIDNTIILVSLTGVYYIENAFIENKPRENPSTWQWKKLVIYNSSNNPLYHCLRSQNIFDVRDLETKKIIIEKESLIPICILNSDPSKLLQNSTFIITLDARFISIRKNSQGILIGQEMVSMMPVVMNPEGLLHIFDNSKFYNRYKFDYLSSSRERKRLDMLYNIMEKEMEQAINITNSKSTTTDTPNVEDNKSIVDAINTEIEDAELAEAIAKSLQEAEHNNTNNTD